jgi:hypothetical protein
MLVQWNYLIVRIEEVLRHGTILSIARERSCLRREGMVYATTFHPTFKYVYIHLETMLAAMDPGS